MFDRDDEEVEETKTRTRKPRKPRQPAEILDLPKQYLVRSKIGNRVVSAESKEYAKAMIPNSLGVALMGTSESQQHAEKRLGW